MTQRNQYVSEVDRAHAILLSESVLRAQAGEIVGTSTLKTPGYVYFIQAGDVGLIKIGWATDPKRRLTQMQPHCPIPLRLLHSERGTGADERAVHGRFAEHRAHHEWFHPVSELLAYIAQRITR